MSILRPLGIEPTTRIHSSGPAVELDRAQLEKLLSDVLIHLHAVDGVGREVKRRVQQMAGRLT